MSSSRNWPTVASPDLLFCLVCAESECRGTNLVVRAEASLATGAHVQELPSSDDDVATPEVHFYSFISHSSKDQAFADRLYADLQSSGVRCWFARHDMTAGKKVHEQIDEAIRLHDRLLLVLSTDSLASSWVEIEVAKARRRELDEGRRVLFPVRLVTFESLRNWECFDVDTGKDSAREIREYFIPDFRRWKDRDCYRKAFARLLHDLKAEA